MVQEFSMRSERLKPYKLATEALKRLKPKSMWLSSYDDVDVTDIDIVFLEGTNVDREQFFGSHFAQYWYTLNDHTYVDPPEEEIQRELDYFGDEDWVLLKYRVSYEGNAEYMEILVDQRGRVSDGKWGFRVEEYDIGGLGLSDEFISNWKTADEAQEIAAVTNF